MTYKTYFPQTLQEALEILKTRPATPFAGGTDLMIRKRQWQGARRRFTQDVVFISHLAPLKHLVKTEHGLSIGACVTQQTCVDSTIVPDHIKRVIALMATPAIRNAATIGGNIVNAARVADTLPMLVALGASLVLESHQGQRQVLVKDFIKGTYQTDLQAGELLVSVEIPDFHPTFVGYQKLGNRKASILSKLSVYVAYAPDDLRIAIGAVNDNIIRSEALEQAWQKDKDLPRLLKGYQALMESYDDKRSTRAYRETVSLNLIEQFMKEMTP